MAIENAVKKAEASSEISNFTIDDSKMRAYSSNEKLDLSKLEASLTFKNGKGVVKFLIQNLKSTTLRCLIIRLEKKLITKWH